MQTHSKPVLSAPDDDDRAVYVLRPDEVGKPSVAGGSLINVRCNRPDYGVDRPSDAVVDRSSWSSNARTAISASPAFLMDELPQFFHLMPIAMIKFRADGAIDLVNPMASALLLSVWPNDPHHNLYTLLARSLPELAHRVTGFAAAAGTIIDQQRCDVHDGDDARVLSLTVNRINAAVFIAVLKDVTVPAELERSLCTDRQRFFAMFDHVQDYAIYTITAEGKIEEWNHSVQRYGGWSAEDVQGRDLSLFLPPDDPDRPHLDRLLAEALRTGSVETEGWRVKRDGSRLWESMVITALPDDAGNARRFVVVSHDLTERKRAEDNMKLLASIDSLTGAYNRRQGDVLLAADFTRRSRDRRDFAVLMLDIDNFKSVNDRFGHAAGDAVLCELAHVSRKTLRAIDTLVRRGGDEFLVLLPDTKAAPALAAAERLRAAVEMIDVAVGDIGTIRFTVSIGVAVPLNDDQRELLHRADLALYAAKRGGRNRAILAI